jgi:major membrane immunogen (membrane-anchored lipoprotein)
LCDRFGFWEIAAKLSKFCPSIDFKEGEAEDADARGRISVFEEKPNQHFHVIAISQSKITQLSTDFGRLVGKVSALRSDLAGDETLSEEISPLEAQIGQNLKDSVAESLSTDVTELRKEVLTHKVQIAAMLRIVTLSQNQPPLPSPCVPLLDFRIISEIRAIFAEFRKEHFSLPGRGSRDGFKVQESPRRCEVHPSF